MDRLAVWLDRYSLHLALPVVWVAMLGSLYFSEVQHFVPCALCWYQRILMYPLAGILLVGLLRRDESLPYYTLLFSLIGIGVSSYHYLLQKTLWFGAPTACGAGPSCAGVWINWFGFITIPFLALLAFIIITLFTFVALFAPEDELADSQSIEPISWLPVLGPVLLICAIFGVMWYQSGSDVAATEVQGIDIMTPLASSDDITLANGNLQNSGAVLYQEKCASCHGSSLEGVEGLGNSLTDSSFIRDSSHDALLSFIQKGRAADDPQNKTGMAMPPLGGHPDLNSTQVTEIVKFLQSQQ